MSEEMNKKGLLILTIVLWVVVLGLCGWMVYDKYIKYEEPKQEEKTNNNEESKKEENNNEEEFYSLETYPSVSDDVEIGYPYELLDINDMKSDFKNLEKEKKGNTFLYNCTDYSEKDKRCYGISVMINDFLEFSEHYDEDDDWYGSSRLEGLEDWLLDRNYEKIYKVNNFYIVEDLSQSDNFASQSLFVIYDKNKQKVYFGYNDDGLDSVDIPNVVFKNNKMHIVETVCGPEDSIESKKTCNHDFEFEYNIIDLSKDEINIKKVTEFYVDNPLGDE